LDHDLNHPFTQTIHRGSLSRRGSSPVFVTRPGCRRQTQDQNRPDRCPRPGCLDRRPVQATRWIRVSRRGELFPARGGKIENLYTQGAVRNIATFHHNVTGGVFTNDTVRRSVDGCLARILGREAAARGTELTMEQLLKENHKLQPDLTGLKA
jgi:hypothetical protein